MVLVDTAPPLPLSRRLLNIAFKVLPWLEVADNTAVGGVDAPEFGLLAGGISIVAVVLVAVEDAFSSLPSLLVFPLLVLSEHTFDRLRPVKINIKTRSVNRMVSKAILSSPEQHVADIIAPHSWSLFSTSFLVTDGDSLHNVDIKLVIVEMLCWEARRSCPMPPVELAPKLPVELLYNCAEFEPSELFGVFPIKGVVWEDTPASANLVRRCSSKAGPCSTKGAGSTTLRENLSAKVAKHLRAPSDTWVSLWAKSFDRAPTHSMLPAGLVGSTLLHKRVTTVIAEWRVSLWMPGTTTVAGSVWGVGVKLALGEVLQRWMKVRTALRPPASNTAPDSREQILSRTWNRQRTQVQTTKKRASENNY